MLTAYVVMHLMVWDADTGVLLHDSGEIVSEESFPVSGSKIEDCRLVGVPLAKLLTERWRERGYANAFTNVDCEWRRRYGDPA